MGQLVVLCRLIFMTGALLGLLALHDRLLSSQQSGGEVYSAHVGSMILMSMVVFYGLCKLGQAASSRPRHILDRKPAHYLNVDGGRTEIVQGVPKLTIENIWILVYGLGAVFFIVTYCFLGIEPVCMTCMGIALSVLCMDELVNPRREMHKLYKVVRIGAFLSGTISLVLVFVEHFPDTFKRYVGSANWPAAFTGIGMPFLSQLLMLCVRDQRRYTLGGVLEMCEFGLSFAVIISVCLLYSAEGERRQAFAELSYHYLENETVEWFHNLTIPDADHSMTKWGIFLGLAPLLLAPTIILYVACVVDGTAVDSLLCISLVVSIEYSTKTQPTVIHIYASVCALMGMLLRVCSEYMPQPLASFTQQDGLHLTNQAIQKARETALHQSETESLADTTIRV